MDFVERMTS